MIKSLKVRLSLLYVGILAIILLTFVILVYLSLRREMHRDLNKQLGIDVTEFSDFLSEEIAEIKRGTSISLPQEIRRYLTFSKSYARVIAQDGTVLFESPELATNRGKIVGMGYPGKRKGYLFQEIDAVFPGHEEPYLIKLVGTQVTDADGKIYYVVYGMDASLIETRLTRYIWYGSVFFPIILLLSWGIGYWFVHRALKPVDDITAEARAMSIDRLEKRVPIPATEGELKRLAMTFNGMLDRIQHAIQELQKFTADVSHELKTPLANLRSQVEVTLKKVRSPEEYQQALSSLLEDIVRITHIVESMLMLSQIESKGFEWTRKDMDFRETMNELYEVGQAMAEAKNIRVTMGAMPEPVTVIGDRNLLKRACFNLLDNAIKYTPQGGGVTLGLSQNASCVNVMVRDTGIGVPDENIPHLFRRFYRVDKARTSEDGSVGLGLAIARSIVELHGGTLTVESQPGKGSLFSISLPK